MTVALIVMAWVFTIWLSILTYIVLNHLRNHHVFRQTYEAWQKSKQEQLS